MEFLECRRVLATITVDSLADNTTADALTTLREAITAANASADADTIVFDSSLFSSGAGTITLGSGLPTIAATSTAGTLTITGPEAATLTVTANNGNFRVFKVAGGGGIYHSDSGTLTISKSTIRGNSANNGGGIITWSSSRVTVDSCEISDNAATSDGGGIYGAAANDIVIANSTISGNRAQGIGGGIYNTIRPHSALGYRPPSPESRQPCAVTSATPRQPHRAGLLEGKTLT